MRSNSRCTRPAWLLALVGLTASAGPTQPQVQPQVQPQAPPVKAGAIEFLGQVLFATGTPVAGTEMGGLSEITYDPQAGRYYAVSDDRSRIDPARFYHLTIDLGDGRLDDGDVVFTGVTTLTDENGRPYPPNSLDPEGLAWAPDGALYLSSEGDARAGIAPFVHRIGRDGAFQAALPVPAYYLPRAEGRRGIRNNRAFESLAVSPDGRHLYAGLENALRQDGPAASLVDHSPARIIRYDLSRGEVAAEWVYPVAPIPAAPVPARGSATNGLVALLALDDPGRLLALERAYSAGVGTRVRLYRVRTAGARDVAGVPALTQTRTRGIDSPVARDLLLDLGTLGLLTDNLEGLALGPELADGRRVLIMVSDNNFSEGQATQFLAFALDLAALARGAAP